MALQTKIALSVEGVRSAALDAGSLKEVHAVDFAATWPSGTSTSQADEVWSDTRTVNAAAHDNLDLTSLTQLDSSGGTVRAGISFAVIKAVHVVNTSSSGYLVIGGGTDGAAAADAWALAGGMLSSDASIVHVPAGGTFTWSDPAGVAVTNSSADILHFGGVTANQTYKVVIVGEST